MRLESNVSASACPLVKLGKYFIFSGVLQESPASSNYTLSLQAMNLSALILESAPHLLIW